jgi:hypothetical protein
MIVLVDERLTHAANENPELQYLLELLADESIEAHLYSDTGPPHDAVGASVERTNIDAVRGWVDVIGGGTDRLRIVNWVKSGVATLRLASTDDSAFDRVIRTTPPASYAEGGNAEESRHQDARAMLSAKMVRADLFITERRLPLDLGLDPWTSATAMAPGDALPVVGLYLRQQGRRLLQNLPALGSTETRVAVSTIDANQFSWRAAQLLLRDSSHWRAVAAAHSQSTKDSTLELLTIAPPHRLSQILSVRDRLLTAMSVVQDMDTATEILDQLDMILIWLMAAFDALARNANVTLGINDDQFLVGWQKTGWLAKVLGINPAAGQLFADDSDGKALLKLLTRFRNNIHGQALSATGVVPVVGEHALQTFMALPAGDRDDIVASVEQLGGLERWGLAQPFADYELHVEPGRFVEQLLVQAIHLMNRITTVIQIEALHGADRDADHAGHRRALSLSDQRILWQLGLLPSPAAA